MTTSYGARRFEFFSKCFEADVTFGTKGKVKHLVQQVRIDEEGRW